MVGLPACSAAHASGSQQQLQAAQQERKEEGKKRRKARKRGQEERERKEEKGRKSQEGRDGLGGSQEKDQNRKMVQTFVKVDGGKTSAMEMETSDKVDDIVKKIPISDRDVYVTWKNFEEKRQTREL